MPGIDGVEAQTQQCAETTKRWRIHQENDLEVAADPFCAPRPFSLLLKAAPVKARFQKCCK